jgi:hypothetical protein
MSIDIRAARQQKGLDILTDIHGTNSDHGTINLEDNIVLFFQVVRV